MSEPFYDPADRPDECTREEFETAMKIDDGGPAFPWEDMKDTTGEPRPTSGMSLRDWFAGMALQSILTAARQGHLSRISSDDPLGPKDYAVSAYANADAMLAARKEAR